MTNYRREMDALLEKERLRARKPFKHFRSLGEYSRIRFPDCRKGCECKSSMVRPKAGTSTNIQDGNSLSQSATSEPSLTTTAKPSVASGEIARRSPFTPRRRKRGLS